MIDDYISEGTAIGWDFFAGEDEPAPPPRTVRRTRKQYTCDVCGGVIAAGTMAIDVATYGQRTRAHVACGHRLGGGA